MIYPFPESALNENAAKLFMDNYQEYFKHAKLLTELHAVSKEKRNILSLSVKLNYRNLFLKKFRKQHLLSLFSTRKTTQIIVIFSVHSRPIIAILYQLLWI